MGARILFSQGCVMYRAKVVIYGDELRQKYAMHISSEVFIICVHKVKEHHGSISFFVFLFRETLISGGLHGPTILSTRA